ncbi:carboxymuconolactone decarboxylase family protein [Putridiphycobacter roseus]|uniref:Carboxymuconolactone decarboxylase family protein n=1 Tax=Putridiphycobacter roseus TaxID=2219161 RepID=A0A2W1N0T8_9FLAO|nr:carboxymuconolactone decarboxylase family protein [Putridiphycobacter roseus]PZE17867.1 carboxymuconolactone decarboxylase family protein [Putridiphycobacter roseus]
MTTFKIHTIESAPEASKQMLEESVKGFGRLPNLMGVMAESPALVEAYKSIGAIFKDKTDFDAEEVTVVWQTINVENDCHYCVPAHTAIAHSMKVDEALTEALRNNTAMPTAKLQALKDMTLLIVKDRGVISDESMQAFFNAGYSTRHYLEILIGYAQKIMSNYTNHAANTAVDEPFQKFAWRK